MDEIFHPTAVSVLVYSTGGTTDAPGAMGLSLLQKSMKKHGWVQLLSWNLHDKSSPSSPVIQLRAEESGRQIWLLISCESKSAGHPHLGLQTKGNHLVCWVRNKDCPWEKRSAPVLKP